MVTWALDRDALARVRFTTSPLWEIGLSALVLRSSNPGPVHAPWVRSVRAGVDAVVLAKVAALTAGSSFVADFLTPIGPRPMTGGLDTELAQLRALDPALIRQDLTYLAAANRHEPDVGHTWIRSLAEAAGTRDVVPELDTALRAYWTGAIAPHWARYLRLVDEDSTAHGRAAARDGAGAMLDTLHPRVRFSAGSLDITGACEASVEQADPSGGVLLVPSAFAWPEVHVQPNAPYQPAIAYGVRGLATLWLTDHEVADHLTRLLGAGRARVLTALSVPSTTLELAHDLSLAASTVNAHLQALTASGLTAAARDGRTVVYHLTDLGRGLTQSR